MSFAGHVLDMINRMKFNESLKQDQKKRRSKIIEASRMKTNHDESYELEYKEIADEELKELKIKIRADIRNENLKVNIRTIAIILIIILLVIILIRVVTQ